MKTNELRIGNIVLINGLRTEVSLLVLKHVIEENIQFTVEGISLTEEILFKCGFEKELSNDDEERIIYSIQISNSTSLYFDRHKDWMRDDLYIEWYLSHEWNNNHFKNDLGWAKNQQKPLTILIGNL